MFTSQPATSTSHWYVFSSFMFAFFCMFFVHSFYPFMFTSQPAISQPLVCFFFFYVRFFAYFLLIFLYFFSASHLSQPSNHPLSHYIDLLLLFTIFLTLQLHVCKYVDSK